MPKFKWYKHRKDKPSYSREERIQLDVNSQLAVQSIQTELNNTLEAFIGSPNTVETAAAMADRITDLMDEYQQRGVIVGGWQPAATEDGDITVSVRLANSPTRISFDINLEALDG